MPQTVTKSDEPTSRVAVFVPSYNHAPFIARCLKSIINQTHAPLELLVIDDGSRDDSPRIIAQVLENCPFPSELIVRENRGLCATLNEGLSKTRGDYFAYLGSDDVWQPEFLAARIALLDANPSAVLGYGHAFLLDENDNIIESSETWQRAGYRDGDARPMLYRGIAPVSSTVCYRRAALAKQSWNENSRLEDYEFYLQLCHTGPFAFDARVLSCWRMHGYNVSRDLPLMLREVLAAQERVAQKLGWDKAQLVNVKRATRFHYAEDYARKGLKKDALRLFVPNLSGAQSLSEIGRTMFRLLLPHAVTEMRRNKIKKNVTAHQGVIEV